MTPISTSEAEAEMMKAAWYDQTGSAQAVLHDELQVMELPICPCGNKVFSSDNGFN